MGQGFVQTCPGPRLGKFTNSSSKWNVWATQEEIWRFLAAAWGEVWGGWVHQEMVVHTHLHRQVGSQRRGLMTPRL